MKFAKLIYPEEIDNGISKELNTVLGDKENRNSFKPATEKVNIMTLHKSKGLEFKCVFLLDVYRWILPAEGNWLTEEDYTQSLNLHYVGITRAIEACYIMQGTKRYRSRQGDYWSTEGSPFYLLITFLI